MTNAHRSHLNDLLIRHSRHEEILFVLVGVELDAVRDLPVGEVRDALACRDRNTHSGSPGHHSKMLVFQVKVKIWVSPVSESQSLR